jgi:hypothetical protein
MAHTTNKMFSQFKLEFSTYKDKAHDTTTFLFDLDDENSVGVTVLWHKDSDDGEGKRVDVECLGGQRYCYTVPVAVPVRVLVTVAPGKPPVLLTPVLVVNGVNKTYPAEMVYPGDLHGMPIKLEMDSGEENIWVLRDQDGEQVLAIVVCGE